MERNLWLKRTGVIDGVDRYEVRKQRRFAYIQAERLTKALIDAFCILPSHKPLHPALIRYNRKLHMLQSVNGSDARYVPLRDWNEAEFAYNPSTPRDRFNLEESIRIDVLDRIKSMESVGADPSQADGYAEVAYN